MTETAWLASTNPRKMLRYLGDETEVWHNQHWQHWQHWPHWSRERKLRLWVEACRKAVKPSREVIWGYYLEDPDQLRAAVADWSRRDNEGERGPVASRADLLREVFGNPFRPVKLPASWLTSDVLAIAQSAYDQRDEVSGHLDPVRRLVLADALEEAGCPAELVCEFCNGRGSFQTSGSYAECPRCLGATGIGTGRVPHPLLTHLRSPGPHVRGCWAIDLVLGND